jgi:hypothetical protein
VTATKIAGIANAATPETPARTGMVGGANARTPTTKSERRDGVLGGDGTTMHSGSFQQDLQPAVGCLRQRLRRLGKGFERSLVVLDAFSDLLLCCWHPAIVPLAG